MFPPFRILVAAGGVKVPLDEIRWLGNRSTGRFGVALAAAARRRGARVSALLADDVADPRTFRIGFADLPATPATLTHRHARHRELVGEGRTRLTVVRFTSFNEYSRKLERLLRRGHFDVAFLTAAVADYAPEPTAGKWPSDREELTLRLRRLPKLIDRCKEWAPRTYVVGFKLLVGATDTELEAAARAGLDRHHADLVVANEWRARRNGRHVLHLVRPNAPTETIGPGGEDDLAERLVARVAQWREEHR